ncbi:hypothetical protein GCM10023082_00900 [Streptomyces tremellae]|uniref:Uncharacterized protein n=1 Tax=Streptomyces tremellae TaxID=1124239 RepID=A0ABP7DQQ7_9ACTN
MILVCRAVPADRGGGIEADGAMADMAPRNMVAGLWRAGWGRGGRPLRRVRTDCWAGGCGDHTTGPPPREGLANAT